MQGICSLERGEAGEREVGGPGAVGEDGEVLGGRVGGRGAGGSACAKGRGGFRHERDIREDDEYLFDESAGRGWDGGGGLFKALEEADRKYAGERGSGFGGASGTGDGKEEEIAVCPVCGNFEGDEKAVAWHVEGHFGG